MLVLPPLHDVRRARAPETCTLSRAHQRPHATVRASRRAKAASLSFRCTARWLLQLRLPHPRDAAASTARARPRPVALASTLRRRCHRQPPRLRTAASRRRRRRRTGHGGAVGAWRCAGRGGERVRGRGAAGKRRRRQRRGARARMCPAAGAAARPSLVSPFCAGCEDAMLGVGCWLAAALRACVSGQRVVADAAKRGQSRPVGITRRQGRRRRA